MNFDDFNIELGTVLYLDEVTAAQMAEVAKGQRPEVDIETEYDDTRHRIMHAFLTFSGLPDDVASVDKALENIQFDMSDGERTALLTIRNIHNRQRAGNATDDDDELLEDTVEAAEAYLMNRLADILEEN